MCVRIISIQRVRNEPRPPVAPAIGPDGIAGDFFLFGPHRLGALVISNQQPIVDSLRLDVIHSNYYSQHFVLYTMS